MYKTVIVLVGIPVAVLARVDAWRIQSEPRAIVHQEIEVALSGIKGTD